MSENDKQEPIGIITNMTKTDMHALVLSAAMFAYARGVAGDDWDDVAEFIVNTLEDNTHRVEKH